MWGWKVGLFDVDEEGLARVAREAGAGMSLARRLDVRDREEYRAAIAAFGEWSGGRMDALFNCAGIMRMGPFEEMLLDEHARTIEINVLGVTQGIHLALPLLKATPGAHVLSMCSASAVYGVPDLAVYAALKFFVRGLTEALNLELAADGIVVTDLMPLYVDTPMVQSQTYRAGSLETFGAHLTPRQIGELAWKAVHAKRVHWRPGLLLKTLNYLGGAFPFVARPTMKYVNRRRAAAGPAAAAKPS